MTIDNRQAAKDEFQYVLDTYIKPLLPTNGNFVVSDNVSTDKITDIIHYDRNSTKFTIYPNTGFPQIKGVVDSIRNCEATQIKSLPYAKEILRHIMLVSNYNRKNDFSGGTKYPSSLKAAVKDTLRNGCFDIAYEYGLCIGMGEAAIFRLLSKMQKWAQKTYEGRKVSLSFIIDPDHRFQKGLVDYVEALGDDYSAVFTDGMSSCIHLNKYGQIIEYSSAESSTKKVAYAPYRFESFANACIGSRVGIISQANGDILIFKNRSLLFVKHSGTWFYLDADNVISTIEKYIDTGIANRHKLATDIYLSILDISFARSGGCIGIVPQNKIDSIRPTIAAGDLHASLDLNKKPHQKINIIKRLIDVNCDGSAQQTFSGLDRKLRKDFLSLDGATVINDNNKIQCTGTILTLKGTADGAHGGRSAAASELSKHGLGIKISTDGYVLGYTEGSSKSEKYEPHLAFKMLC